MYIVYLLILVYNYIYIYVYTKHYTITVSISIFMLYYGGGQRVNTGGVTYSAGGRQYVNAEGCACEA